MVECEQQERSSVTEGEKEQDVEEEGERNHY